MALDRQQALQAEAEAQQALRTRVLKHDKQRRRKLDAQNLAAAKQASLESASSAEQAAEQQRQAEQEVADARREKQAALDAAAALQQQQEVAVEQARQLAVAKAQAEQQQAQLDAMEDFYHGTSLEAGLQIQAGGFDVDLSGSNAGTMLGNGVYVTRTLKKALHYAMGKAEKPNPHEGCVLHLKVDLGKMYTVTGGKKKLPDDPLRLTWFEPPHSYDSCFSPAGYGGEREEHCVRDASRVHVVDVTIGHTGQAAAAGYSKGDCKLMVDREKQVRVGLCCRYPLVFSRHLLSFYIHVFRLFFTAIVCLGLAGGC